MSMNRQTMTVLLSAALAGATTLGLAGCGDHASTPSGTGSTQKITVVTSFYPLQFLTQQIAGDHATVTSLTPPGEEPHDLELAPKQVGSISEAQLVVYQSGFQAQVDNAVAQSGNKHVLDAAQLVTLLPPAGVSEEGEKLTKDPHQWLDPNNMVTIADAIKDQLSDVDPSHKSDFEANAARLDQSLKALDADYRAGLKSCKRTQFITSHAAFQYLAKRYGLTQVGISGLSPDEEPSPTRIAAVQKLAQQYHVTTIFYETLVSPVVAKTIAGDLKLKAEVLDPIEGITQDSHGTNYLEVMKSNLSALKAANECQ